MASVLLASCPVHGHVKPVCAVAADLVDRGHDVRVLTGQRYRGMVEGAGARFLALPAGADYDDSRPDDVDLPGMPRDLPARARSGVRGVALALRYLFAGPAAVQHGALLAALADEPTDVLVSELLFLGVYPLTETPRAQRPLLVLLGISPLPVGGPGLAPYGLGAAPATGPLGRTRNRVLSAVAHRFVTGPAEAFLAAEYERLLGAPLESGIFDLPLRMDLVLQLSAAGLEYPRPGVDNLRFVGPLRRAIPSSVPRPPWWADLAEAGATRRKVVHVTQGTVENTDFGELVVPTVAALADDEDVLVVAGAGGRPEEDLVAAVRAGLGELPSNLRTASYLDYDRLFPLTDVLVTNGGFGAVNEAVAAGVPVVTAGRTQDKPEVGARVAWSGVGVDLRTARPSAAAVAEAVHRVLVDPSYGEAARRMRDEIAGVDPFAVVDEVVRTAAAPIG